MPTTSNPVTLHAEEVEGDPDTTDFLLVGDKAELGDPVVGTDLTGGAIVIGPGLNFLVVGGQANDFPVEVQHIAGDAAQADRVQLKVPKSAFDRSAPTMAPVIGTDYPGTRYDLASGPVVVVPLES